MTTRSNRCWIAVCLVLLVLPAGLAALGAEDDSVRIELQPQQQVMGRIVRYYRPQRVQLADKPAETLTAEPEYVGEKPQYGTLKLGAGDDTDVTIVVDETADQQRLFVDRNNNEDLTDDGDGSWTRTSASTLGASKVAIDVSYESGSIPYTFEFYRFRTRLQDQVLYYRNSARTGTLTAGDKKYRIALLDENADGRFDDLKNITLLIDLNHDGKLVGSSDSAEYHTGSQPFNVHGHVFQVASVSPDGQAMTLEPSDADVAMRPYLDVGYPAPAFAAEGLGGEPLDLREAAADSKFVLLDFWASWCGPCRREYPHLRKLHAQYKNHGLTIIGVNLDSNKDAAVKAAESEALDYAHAYDGQGWKNKVAVLYRVHAIPQTYLLDKDLKIVAKGLRGGGLEARMRALLGAGDVEAAAKAAAAEPAAPKAEAPPAKAEAPPAQRDPRATLSDELALYLGVGGVASPGKIVQLDGRGRLLGHVALPKTPYGLAVAADSLVAASPSAGKVFRIGQSGKITELGDGADFRAPIAVAVDQATGSFYVGDNSADTIFRLTAAGELDGTLQLRERGSNFQNLSLAATADSQVIMGSSTPLGVFRFDFSSGRLGEPLLDADSGVAADPSSARWAVANGTGGIKMFQQDGEVASVSLPAGKRVYRGGVLAFGPAGELVIALSTPQGVELAQVDTAKQRIYTLCSWRGERLVSLAVGPKSKWVLASQTNDQGDRLQVLAFDPPLPAVLRSGQRLTVRVAYDLKSAETAMILVRPMTGGQRSTGYGAHGSPRYSKGSGVMEGSFLFQKPATIDQVSVTLVTDRAAEDPALKLLADADARWSDELAVRRTGPARSPDAPGTADKLKQRLATLPQLDEAQRQALLEDVIAYVKRSDKKAADFSLALSAARAFERAKELEAAATALDAFADIFADSSDERIQGYAGKLKGAARRNRLPGNEMEVFGTTVDGEPFDWKPYRGKVVLVDFWATWCGPCIAELPNVKEQYERYHDQGFDVVAVSLDTDEERMTKFIADREIPWVNLFSADSEQTGWANPLAAHYGIMAIPTTILVDRQGKVVSLNARGPELARLLDELLGKED